MSSEKWSPEWLSPILTIPCSNTGIALLCDLLGWMTTMLGFAGKAAGLYIPCSARTSAEYFPPCTAGPCSSFPQINEFILALDENSDWQLLASSYKEGVSQSGCRG